VPLTCEPLLKPIITTPLPYANTPAKTTAGVSNKAIIGINPNTLSLRLLDTKRASLLVVRRRETGRRCTPRAHHTIWSAKKWASRPGCDRDALEVGRERALTPEPLRAPPERYLWRSDKLPPHPTRARSCPGCTRRPDPAVRRLLPDPHPELRHFHSPHSVAPPGAHRDSPLQYLLAG
jgi:hypothetical protein